MNDEIVGVRATLGELLKFGGDLAAFGDWLGGQLKPQLEGVLSLVGCRPTLDDPASINFTDIKIDEAMKLAWLKAHQLPASVIDYPPFVLDGGKIRLDIQQEMLEQRLLDLVPGEVCRMKRWRAHDYRRLLVRQSVEYDGHRLTGVSRDRLILIPGTEMVYKIEGSALPDDAKRLEIIYAGLLFDRAVS